MKKILYFLSIFFAGELYAQEAPLLYDIQQNGGRLLPELNNEAAKFLICKNPAFQFWLFCAELAKKQKNSKVYPFPFQTPDGKPLDSDAFEFGNTQINATGTAVLVESLEIGYFLLNIKSEKHVQLGKITEFEFSNDGKLAAIAADENLVIFDVEESKIILTLEGHTDTIRKLKFAKNDNFLIGSGGLKSYVWNTKTGRLMHVLQHAHVVEFADFNSNASKIVTCAGKNTYIWDKRTWQCTHILNDKFDPDLKITYGEFHPRENLILLHAFNENNFQPYIYIWNLDTEINSFKLPNAKEGHFSLDGSCLIALMPDFTEIYKQNKEIWLPVLINLESYQLQYFNENPALVEKIKIENPQRIHINEDGNFALITGRNSCVCDLTNRYSLAVLPEWGAISNNFEHFVYIRADNAIAVAKLCDQNIKEELIKKLTIDNAKFLLDSHKYAISDPNGIPFNARNIRIFKSLPPAIKKAHMFAEKIKINSLAQAGYNSKKRKIQEITQ